VNTPWWEVGCNYSENENISHWLGAERDAVLRLSAFQVALVILAVSFDGKIKNSRYLLD
jgi:hypothetical protein